MKSSDLLSQLPEGSRVAIIRLRSLGDCVLCTPAIDLLKRFRPDLEVAVAVEDRFAEVFRGNPAVAEVLPPAATSVRGFAPDLCLNLHGGGRSTRMTLLSKAKFRAGFDIFKPSWAYNAPIPTAQEVLGITRRVHTAEHMASAMFHLGVPVCDVPRAVVPAPATRSPHAPDAPYMVIHPLASAPEKTWPAANFLELARFASRDLGLEPVVIGAAADDLSHFMGVRTVRGESLSRVAQLLRDASLFVGNDSGPAHMAAAFGVPQVVFFGPSDHEIWSPWRTEATVLKGNPIESIPVDHARRAMLSYRVQEVGAGSR